MPCNWQVLAGSQYMIAGKKFTDPLQGSQTPNCAFIGALIAVSWVDPLKLPEQTRNGAGGLEYGVTFYKAGAPQITWVTAKLCLTPGGLLQHASSITTGEIWPAIWEKAYAKFLLNTAADTFNFDQVPWGGNSANALINLTNNPFQIKETTTFADGTTTANFIQAKCAGGKSINPMVAWTYAVAPPGVLYPAGILINHAYALLGVLTVGAAKYIVLRNPRGGPDPTQDTYTQGSWLGIQLATLNDGIFAINAIDF
ncbi:MAG: C2 family cysteine protease [Methanomicrobiales archaeon]|nr:C2 family cysteine protease [Methanomicrobiales archaeon]